MNPVSWRDRKLNGDGHTGVSNEQVNEGGSGHFRLVLSYLKQASGHGQFVMHATSSTYYTSGDLQPLDFLEKIGFQQHQGQCKFLGASCRFRVVGSVRPSDFGIPESICSVLIQRVVVQDIRGKPGLYCQEDSQHPITHGICKLESLRGPLK